jgi:catechol 1,2-dioxygenase
MIMRIALVIVLAFAGTAAAPVANDARALVGMWELVSRVQRDAQGNVVPEPSLGSDPVGYITYDSSGRMAVQLMARHRSGTPCATTARSDANNIEHVGGYDAYFGRYVVDTTAQVVTHTLEGSISPVDVGRKMTRRYRLDGDTLTLEFEPGGAGSALTRTLVWRRVKG